MAPTQECCSQQSKVALQRSKLSGGSASSPHMAPDLGVSPGGESLNLICLQC